MPPDMGRLRRRIGERDRPVEGDAGLLATPELQQQPALHPEEMKIAGKPWRQGLDHGERRRRTADLGNRDGPIERDDGRWLQGFERGVEEIDLRPIGVPRAGGSCMQRRDRRLHLIGAPAPVAHRLVDERQVWRRACAVLPLLPKDA